MNEAAANDVEKLLLKVMVFKYDFKQQILEKIRSGLAEEKIAELKKIIAEALAWQKDFLSKKIKSDPDFYSKITTARQKIDEELIRLYSQDLQGKDKDKIKIILEKIKLL